MYLLCMYVCVCMCVCKYVCMYVCTYVRTCVCAYVYMYVCMYRLRVTTKIPINKIGKVFRKRTGYLALPVPRPTGSVYREFDPQSQFGKLPASHNHPQVLGL